MRVSGLAPPADLGPRGGVLEGGVDTGDIPDGEVEDYQVEIVDEVPLDPPTNLQGESGEGEINLTWDVPFKPKYEPILDGGFENGPYSEIWTDATGGLPTAIMSKDALGLYGARSGRFAAVFDETTTVTQQFMLPKPSTNVYLRFYLWNSSFTPAGTSALQVVLDGKHPALCQITEGDSQFTSNLVPTGWFRPVEISPGAFDELTTHTLQIGADISEGTIFHVDDVGLFAEGDDRFGDDESEVFKIVKFDPTTNLAAEFPGDVVLPATLAAPDNIDADVDYTFMVKCLEDAEPSRESVYSTPPPPAKARRPVCSLRQTLLLPVAMGTFGLGGILLQALMDMILMLF